MRWGWLRRLLAFGRGGVTWRGGPPEKCVCPICGREYPKIPGVPCQQMRCEQCGVPLVGKCPVWLRSAGQTRQVTV